MQAIILAAGEGIRLRPYTQLIPKPLMTINGIPLLTFHIDKLNSLGISNEKIIVVVSYLKEEIIGFLNRFHKGVKIIEQGEKRGTAAAVTYAKQLIEDNEIVIVYGDTIFEDDLKDFIREENAIGVYEVEDVSRFGKIVVENGYLKRIKEKTETGRGFIFAGLVKTKKEFLEEVDKVKQNEKSEEYYLTDAIVSFNQKYPFKIYPLKGKWSDIGKEESLIEARKVFNFATNCSK
ncbi:MAG: nucleotidyltransferase family protein [Candidatus Aenigmarchaeota archaeon]|nr:nucleotidyltransferase family protein [Candidatus Aenigmarchaeota archaeon]